MWHIKLSKREFLEFWISGGRSLPSKAARIQSAGVVETDDFIRVFWKEEPSEALPFPTCIVGTELQLSTVLTAINASPSSTVPISAFSRLISTNDFNEYSRSASMDFSGVLHAAIVALVLAEAVWHSEGKVGLRQISFAACKRTYSYAFGRALAGQLGGEGLERLPTRWLDVYSILNANASHSQLREMLSVLTSSLRAFTSISWGLPPRNESTELAIAIHLGDRQALRSFWSRYSRSFAPDVELDSLQASTRENRANYLQAALDALANSATGVGLGGAQRSNLGSAHGVSGNDGEVDAAVCAFIATQIAPGSLEHLELLRQAGSPALVFWYALYAALQAPGDILAAQSGLGFKIYRGLTAVEDLLSTPSADISYEEIKIFERTGLDGLARNFGHQNEVVVELVPGVSSSFTYGLRQARGSRSDSNSSQVVESTPNEIQRLSAAYKSKIDQAAYFLAQLSRELPEIDEPYRRGSKRKP
jgi:hypothetical protein